MLGGKEATYGSGSSAVLGCSADRRARWESGRREQDAGQNKMEQSWLCRTHTSLRLRRVVSRMRLSDTYQQDR